MSPGNRIVSYFMAPEVPWFYRVLMLLTAALFLGGAYIDINVLAGIKDATDPHYLRLTKLSDFFYDFGKVSFGTLIGGLSALVARKDERKKIQEEEAKEDNSGDDDEDGREA